MKALLTITTVFLLSFTSVAQNSKEVKVETTNATVVLDIIIKKESKLEKEVARVYMFKNSRVKKELKFRTKRNRSKLA